MSVTLLTPSDLQSVEEYVASVEATLTASLQSLAERVDALEAPVVIDPGSVEELPLVWHANSGPSSELRQTLVISGLAQPYQHVVYSVRLPVIQAGDIIKAWATFEVTHEFAENVMVCRGLRICASATATAGTKISADSCRNVTPGMHHDSIQDFGSIVGTPGMSQMWLNFVAYANHYELPGAAVRVEPDYGRLFVEVTRKAAMEN